MLSMVCAYCILRVSLSRVTENGREWIDSMSEQLKIPNVSIRFATLSTANVMHETKNDKGDLVNVPGLKPRAPSHDSIGMRQAAPPCSPQTLFLTFYNDYITCIFMLTYDRTNRLKRTLSSTVSFF